MKALLFWYYIDFIKLRGWDEDKDFKITTFTKQHFETFVQKYKIALPNKILQ